MDVTGEHDVRGAQPRRGRDDALANTGCVDADHRGVLEDPRPRPPRQRRQTMDVFAAVELECPRKIHAMEIAIGLEVIANAIDLPTFYISFEILSQHLQPADQLIADIDVGDFKRAFAERHLWN